MTPRVAIVIVNWNGAADTAECLASLRADRYPNKRIIMVDNGSTDGSAAILKRECPDVTVLETGANLGFTGGNNVGIRWAVREGADYVLLLNNDTTVEPDVVAQLVDAAERMPEYGLLTPVIHYYDPPREAWFAGSRMDLSRGMAVHDNSRIPDVSGDVQEVPWASGCAMLLKADLLSALNGFDERFFLNWEDVDLSLRVRAAGKRIGLVPGARIYHKVSRSMAKAAGRSTYYHIRNNLLIVAQYGDAPRHGAMLSVIALRFREALRAVKNGNRDAALQLTMTMRAIWDHVHRHYGPLA